MPVFLSSVPRLVTGYSLYIGRPYFMLAALISIGSLYLVRLPSTATPLFFIVSIVVAFMVSLYFNGCYFLA